MKFTNGYWMIREGIEAHYASQVYDCTKTDKELIVYTPDKPVITRGDTLNRMLLTVRYSSPMRNIIRVKLSHFEGAYNPGPHFTLYEDSDFNPEIIIEKNEKAVLKSGELSVHISLNSLWDVSFKGKEKLLTKNETRSTAYIIDSEKGTFTKDELSLGIGEYVYGFGERFGPFIKNGQSIDIWNADAGTASEQAYKNIPFYLTNKGYGVFVNTPAKISFEVASEKNSRVQFSVQGECLEYYVIYGPDPKQILERYTALTGRPPLLADWTFGLWLSTSFTTNYDEKTVMGFIDGMIERKIPLKVFHFDCFWMKGFHWCDFTWDSEIFPDPKAMLSRIKDKGLKICVWINPYIAQMSPLFEEGKKNAFLLRKKDGSVWQTDMWQAGMGIVDFTNPLAVKWYTDCLDRLIEMGVDSFKTDFGERIPDDVVYFNGGDPALHHNYYSYLYNKTVFKFLEEKKGKGSACLFARSATSGCQKFPVHWGGDCESTFSAMAETLRGGLSLGLSGFGYWSHDIGGFEGTPDAGLFKRWLAFGFLSSHSRLHGSNSYRVPWNVDKESVDVCRFFAVLKEGLLPYLKKTALSAHQEGVPMMRAMFLEFPDDPVCLFLDRQYMLGESILVAPVFSQDNIVEYYLPTGTWTHLIDKRVKTGGVWLKEEYDFMSLPLWTRREL